MLPLINGTIHAKGKQVKIELSVNFPIKKEHEFSINGLVFKSRPNNLMAWSKPIDVGVGFITLKKEGPLSLGWFSWPDSKESLDKWLVSLDLGLKRFNTLYDEGKL